MSEARAGSLVYWLATVATALGVSAAVAGSPYRARRASIDVDALSRIVANEDDHVTAVELARWIKERRAGLRVIDLRPESDYNLYHIPTAVRVSIDSVGETTLHSDETIVLYSEGGAHAAQAWVFMRALGYHRVYFLRGGLLDWLDDVMNPTLSDNASKADSTAFDAAAPLSRYFGGVPRSGVPADSSSRPALPKSESNAYSAVKRLRRRGC